MITFSPMTTQEERVWIDNRIYPIWCQDSEGLMAYQNGKIVAGCVADSFSRTGCSVHIAIENPMVIRHGFIHNICHHLFIERDRSVIFGFVASDNHKALKWDKHIGMTEEAVLRNGYDVGVDLVILRMDRDSCRWLDIDMKKVA